VLLFGEKRDSGLYNQEEVEIARASGERLLDALAGAELARRLMLAQRARLAESQVIDRRTRRTLHDEILPQVHAIMLTLQPTDGSVADAQTQLADIHRQISGLLRALPPAITADIARLGLLETLRRAVQEEFDGQFDAVAWDVSPESDAALRRLPPLTAEVLYCAAREAIRNAGRYGRGTSPNRVLGLTVRVRVDDDITVSVEDDGVGVTGQTASTGSGSGALLHGTMMTVIGGAWITETGPGEYTRVTLRVPFDDRVAHVQ